MASNIGGRNQVTDTIRSGGFILGISDYGGGYITKIEIPGLGDIMGTVSRTYGRGGQSSIRDMGRKGCYNPTQAGYSDIAGTECQVTKTKGKMVVEPRGCCLFNGDGGFDYTRWENITPDPYPNDGGNTDLDNIDEENLSVNINGYNYVKQEAEVYSDFDFYGEYENYKEKVGLSVPCIRHYLEYRFIRSISLPNSAMKQFSKSALSTQGYWDDSKILSQIPMSNPLGNFPGGEDHLNSVLLSYSLRNDTALWDPNYRYVQLKDGTWQTQTRSTQFEGNETAYKLRFIVAESNDETKGNALGFYRPDSYINKYNVVGIKESTNSEVYVDNRIVDNYYLDIRYRIPTMSWIGFRNESRGLISRAYLTGINSGVYEKQRQESFYLYGTPAQLKAAFAQLDKYYSNLTEVENIKECDMKSFSIFPNPSNVSVNLKFNSFFNSIRIYNSVGAIVYSNAIAQNEISIPTRQLGGKGVYIINVNNTTQKLIISN